MNTPRLLSHFRQKRHQHEKDLTLLAPVSFDRAAALQQLDSEHFDLVIVGGGITGAYTALDAALRGLRVALVEKDDFASGTSSKSSKMVHGGLRYIEQGNLPLVRHSLLERQRLRRNAPHIVQRLPFMFPILKQGGVVDRRLAAGFESLLWSYDLAGGWREGRLHQRLDAAEVISRCPTLDPASVEGGLVYFDARADDARLTLAVARTAAGHGATLANHTRAVQTLRRDGRVSGVRVEADGREFDISARCVVMSSGVWLRDWTGADPGRSADEGLQVRPAKGVHVAVPWLKIRNDCTVTIPVPGRSRRATITRWGDVSILGTTDEDYQGDLDDVLCTRSELDFLLEGANSALRTELEPTDVVGSIAGCRPLIAPAGGATMEVKRNHEIRTGADGLVTVVGGKLTTARHMAEQAVDAALTVLDRKARCRTVRAPLVGGAGFDAQASVATGGVAAHLGERYGTESMFISQILAEDPAHRSPLVEGLPYLAAEAVFAIRHEMARSVADVLERRTRSRLYARDSSEAAAPRVAELLRSELGLSGEETDRQVRKYHDSIATERTTLMGADR